MSLTNTEKRQLRSDLFLYIDGIALVPAISFLYKHDILSKIDLEDEIEEINIACNKIKEQIDEFCKRSSYYWYNLKTDKEKDEFMKKFIDSSLKHKNIKKK